MNPWVKNLYERHNNGIFRTINGNADELIAIGRSIKAGFPCARVETTNARYDAVIDLGDSVLLRLQIKGVKKGGTASFTGGHRSGAQISKKVPQRTYKYTKNDCDVFMLVDTENGDCYIIPVEDTESWGKTKSLSKLGKYKENWDILKKYAKKS